MSWVPITPGGTLLMHLASATRERAIERLVAETAHMHYRDWDEMSKRGYEVQELKCAPASDARFPTTDGMR